MAVPYKTFPVKDPNDVLPYEIDWGPWLAGDTITSAPTWTVPGGITNDATAYGPTWTRIQLSGGTTGTNYDIACKIVTVGGLTVERTFRVPVETR